MALLPPARFPGRRGPGQWICVISLVASVSGLSAACVSFSTSGSSSPSGGANGTSSSDGASSDGAAESPEVVAERERAKEEFKACAAEFDGYYEKWKAQDEKTRKVIAEIEGLGFYEAFGKLVGQFHENCRTARATFKDSHPDAKALAWARKRGTANGLALAIAKLQVKHEMTPATPLDRGRDDYVRYPPLTGDADFDRNEYCAKGSPNPKWLTPKENEAFQQRRAKMLEEQFVGINKLIDEMNADAEKVGADRGRVKSVKKLADGTHEITVKNLYGGAVCQHTGNWTYNGTFWSDCSYVPAAEKEIYPFTVKLAADRMPPTGIKVGDVISVWGFRTPGPNQRDPKENAQYEGIYVDSVHRANKPVWDVDISVAGELSCLR